jgi:hypothetical protein
MEMTTTMTMELKRELSSHGELQLIFSAQKEEKMIQKSLGKKKLYKNGLSTN